MQNNMQFTFDQALAANTISKSNISRLFLQLGKINVAESEFTDAHNQISVIGARIVAEVVNDF